MICIRNFRFGRSKHDSNHFEPRACVILDLGYLACARKGDFEKEKVVVSQGTVPGILSRYWEVVNERLE